MQVVLSDQNMLWRAKQMNANPQQQKQNIKCGLNVCSFAYFFTCLVDDHTGYKNGDFMSLLSWNVSH